MQQSAAEAAPAKSLIDVKVFDIDSRLAKKSRIVVKKQHEASRLSFIVANRDFGRAPPAEKRRELFGCADSNTTRPGKTTQISTQENKCDFGKTQAPLQSCPRAIPRRISQYLMTRRLRTTSQGHPNAHRTRERDRIRTRPSRVPWSRRPRMESETARRRSSAAA